MNILFFLTPKKDVAYIRQDCTIRQALEKMEYHGYTAIPMIDKEGRYVGVVTEGDFLRTLKNRFNMDLQEMEKRNVTELDLSRWHEPIGVNADIEDLFLIAASQNFVPVVDDNGVFIGIITRKDIIGYCAGKLLGETISRAN